MTTSSFKSSRVKWKQGQNESDSEICTPVYTVSYPPNTSGEFNKSGGVKVPERFSGPYVDLMTPYTNINMWQVATGQTATMTICDDPNIVTHWKFDTNIEYGAHSRFGVTCFPSVGVDFWDPDSPDGNIYGAWTLFWQSLTSYIAGWTEHFDHGSTIAASCMFDIWVERGWTYPPDNSNPQPIHPVSPPVNEVMIHFDNSMRLEDFLTYGNYVEQGISFGGYTVNGVYIPEHLWSLIYDNGTWIQWSATDINGNPDNIESGAIDIKAMMQWLVDHNYLEDNLMHSQIGLGYEICETYGEDRSFHMHDCFVRSS